MTFRAVLLLLGSVPASQAFCSDIRVARPSLFRQQNSHSLQSVPTPLDTLTSGLASICRLPKGVTVAPERTTSDEVQKIVLFDTENSFDCRIVRERITELDLVVMIVPAAPNSRVFVDPSYEYSIDSGVRIPALKVNLNEGNTLLLQGKDEILFFLNRNFATTAAGDDGNGDETAAIKKQVLDVLLSVGGYVSSWLRSGRGVAVAECASTVSKSVNRPEGPLVLYNYEGNQFCRLVREVLTELDLPYELRSAGKESPRRTELANIAGGSSQCPYLIDPNTGTQMPESADIVKYLYKTYALYIPPPELLRFASDKILDVAKPFLHILARKQAGEGNDAYESSIVAAKQRIGQETSDNSIVVYTYQLSPFCTEAVRVLKDLGVTFKEISLGLEWLPGLISEEGAATRAALLDMYDQSSMPHIFVEGRSIGGLYSGSPGLLPAIEAGQL